MYNLTQIGKLFKRTVYLFSLCRHLIVITILQPVPTTARYLPEAVNNTIRIGYVTDQVDPTVRIAAINEAIRQAQLDGLLSGFNFRSVHLKLIYKCAMHESESESVGLVSRLTVNVLSSVCTVR